MAAGDELRGRWSRQGIKWDIDSDPTLMHSSGARFRRRCASSVGESAASAAPACCGSEAAGERGWARTLGWRGTARWASGAGAWGERPAGACPEASSPRMLLVLSKPGARGWDSPVVTPWSPWGLGPACAVPWAAWPGPARSDFPEQGPCPLQGWASARAHLGPVQEDRGLVSLELKSGPGVQACQAASLRPLFCAHSPCQPQGPGQPDGAPGQQSISEPASSEHEPTPVTGFRLSAGCAGACLRMHARLLALLRGRRLPTDPSLGGRPQQAAPLARVLAGLGWSRRCLALSFPPVYPLRGRAGCAVGTGLQQAWMSFFCPACM